MNLMHRFCIIIIFTFIGKIDAQTYFGVIKNTSNKTLQRATIIAEPLGKDGSLQYAIADHLGRYKLTLEKNISYSIKVSHLSCKAIAINILANFKKKEKNFILEEKEELLKEVVINYEPKSVVVKKDTIIYDVKSFTNGLEFKMIDALEKIPGIEIEGTSIKIQGKKVSKILVENKSFFGGSTKLALENIPAEALSKIEVIDKFNEVEMLKQVSDSDQLVINVKLKKNRKKFIFGDFKAGSAIANEKGYFELNSALFSYNGKTDLSFLANTNNVGNRSFSYEDLNRFQNGVSKFIQQTESGLSLSSLTENNRDLIKNKSVFTAFSANLRLNNNTDLESFVVFSEAETTSFKEAKTQYFTDSTNEFRETLNKNEENIALGSVKLKHSPSKTSKLIYNTQFQFAKPKYALNLNSVINSVNTNFKKIDVNKQKQFQQYFEWHKKYNLKHISTVVVSHSFKNDINNFNWNTNSVFFKGLAPVSSDLFNINQTKKITSNTIDALLKHYWVINGTHHLYTNIGNNLHLNKTKTNEYQKINNSKVNFPDTFGNDLNYNFNDFYIGLEYKLKLRKWDNKFSLFSHLYNLKTKQNTNLKSFQNLFEPKWNSEYNFSSTEKLELNYSFGNEFPSPNQLLGNFTLINYNTIYKGNPFLKNEKFHTAELLYDKSNIYKGLFIYASAKAYKKIRSIRNNITFDGINQIFMPALITTPETNLSIFGMIEKQIYKFRLSFRPSFRMYDFYQTRNNKSYQMNRKNSSFYVKIKTSDRKLPKIGIGYRKSFSQLNNNSILVSDNFNLFTNFRFLDNFNFKGNYNLLKNQNQTDNYHSLNAFLRFRQKNKPLSFEIAAKNILNAKFKTSNYFSDYMVIENNTHIFQRTLMLSVVYKI